MKHKVSIKQGKTAQLHEKPNEEEQNRTMHTEAIAKKLSKTNFKYENCQHTYTIHTVFHGV